jgi:hypothetical protein
MSRPNLFNLILVGRDPPGCGAYSAVVNSVIDHYPCRVLCVNICTEGDQLQVARDQPDLVTIRVGGAKRREVPLLVLPDLLDRPTHLIWELGPTEERDTLLRLQKLATRVIFDSDGAPSATNFCCTLLSDMGQFRADLTELNWAYIQGWRSVLAEAFRTPGALELLRSTTQLTITYNGRQEPFCRRPDLPALMLQAWLASRLHWTHQSTLRPTITYSGPVTVTLAATQQADLPPASIASIEFVAPNQRLFLQTEKGLNRVRVESSLHPNEQPHRLPLREMRREEAILDQLFLARTSPQLRPTLEVLSLVEGGCEI